MPQTRGFPARVFRSYEPVLGRQTASACEDSDGCRLRRRRSSLRSSKKSRRSQPIRSRSCSTSSSTSSLAPSFGFETKICEETALADFFRAGHREPQPTLECPVYPDLRHWHRHHIVEMVQVPRSYRHAFPVRNTNHVEACGRHVKRSCLGLESAAIDSCCKLEPQTETVAIGFDVIHLTGEIEKFDAIRHTELTDHRLQIRDEIAILHRSEPSPVWVCAIAGLPAIQVYGFLSIQVVQVVTPDVGRMCYYRAARGLAPLYPTSQKRDVGHPFRDFGNEKPDFTVRAQIRCYRK